MKRSLPTRRSFLAGATAVPALAALDFAWTPALAQAAKDGGVLTLIGSPEPSAMLSLVNVSITAYSTKATEGLLEFDFGMQPRGLLAESWEVAPDGLTYTFKLRQGVTWHDGQPFTSADVAFSLDVLKRMHPRGRTTFAQVTDIETPDDHTVVLRLAKPCGYLLTALSSAESPIAPKHVYGDADPLTHPNNNAPIGTGPYIFKEWVRGSHAIWEKNPNYWNKPYPHVDRLVARFVRDPAARTIAFETEAGDLGFRTPVPFRDLARMRENPNLVIEERGYDYSPPNILMLETNLEDKTLSDIRVRQAIAHSIDREAIARIVFFGYAKPSAAPVVPNLTAFHNPKPSPYPYDLEAAGKLLDEAGFPAGAGGNRLTLTLDFWGDDQRPLADFLRAALARVGIQVEQRITDQAGIVKRVYTDRDYQLHLASLSNLFDPQVGVQRLYWSKNIIKGVGYSNGTAYSNPEVDALLERAAASTDQQERINDWMTIQDIVMRDVPNIPLVMAQWLTIANKRVKDHTMNSEGPEGSLARVHVE